MVVFVLFFFFLLHILFMIFFFFSSRRRHTRLQGDWSSDVCSSDLARPSSSRRSRKSLSTLWWKPGSSRSRPSAYLKSIRHRTASAASRSDRSSRNCSTLTVASCAGEIPGRPSRGYHPAKSSSAHRPSSRSRTHIAVVPAGLLARATRAVSSGTSTPRRGRIDITHSSGSRRVHISPQDWPRASLQSAKYQDSRQSQALTLRRKRTGTAVGHVPSVGRQFGYSGPDILGMTSRWPGRRDLGAGRDLLSTGGRDASGCRR